MGEPVPLTMHGGGSGPLRVVLIHGMGASSAAWLPLVALLGNRLGRWIAPDLRGHGRSPWAMTYRSADYRADLDALLAQEADGEPLILLGHSLGGLLAVQLAAAGRWPTATVFALAVKTSWSHQQLQLVSDVQLQAGKMLPNLAEALLHHRRQSGLVAASAEEADLRVADGGYRLATDPAVFEVEPFEMAFELERISCPVHFAGGSRDPMVPIEDLRRYDPSARVLPDLGHNAMLQRPQAVLDWMVSQLPEPAESLTDVPVAKAHRLCGAGT